MDTVKIVCGQQPNRFSFSAPAVVPAVTYANANANSQPIPKDGIFATYNAFLSGTGAVSATMTFQATNDPHTAGADDPALGFRNNFAIGTTSGSATITSAEGLFRADMNSNEVYAGGVPNGTTMTYVSKTSATLSANATATGTPQARFQSTNWVLLATVTLTGTNTATDGFATMSAWKWVRVVVSALTGTGVLAFAIQGN